MSKDGVFIMSRVKNIVLNILGIMVGTVLAIFFLEILLRVHNPFQVRIKGERIVLESNKKYKIHNEIIKRLDSEITIARNSIGFRGAEPPPELSRAVSIISIGGSTTQCFFLSEGETWTDRLGVLLKPFVRNLWVNNAGLDGHSTYGHQVLLEDHILKLKPKIVVLLVGANDMGRDPGAEWDAENVKSGISFASTAAFVKSLSPYSEVASLVANLFRSLNAYKRGLIHQNVDIKTLGEHDFDENRRRVYRSANLLPKYTEGFRNRLTKIVSVARAAGIEPVLMTQPGLLGEGVDPETGVNLERVLLGPGATANGKMWWEVMEGYNEITREVGLNQHVVVVDLAHRLTKTSRYFYDTIHFSSEGAEAVARILASEVCPVLSSKYPQDVIRPCESFESSVR